MEYKTIKSDYLLLEEELNNEYRSAGWTLITILPRSEMIKVDDENLSDYPQIFYYFYFSRSINWHRI